MITNAHDTHDTTTATYDLPSMTETRPTSVATDQVPKVAQAPSVCRLCDVELSAGQSFKTHLKSDQHVYNLRMKVAVPESATSPPTPPPTDAPRTSGRTSTSPRRRQPSTATVENESEEDDEDSDFEDEEEEVPDFIPGECLFCPQDDEDLDASLAHMATAHGFTVPYQDCLAVDIETVVWYMHFVIHGYQECICCGTRRGTVEAIQQHMKAKGHCRFDISTDTEEFYEMPKEENAVLDQTRRDDSATVRLPSGRVISHRKIQEPQEPRPRRSSPNPALEAITSGTASSSSSSRANHRSTKASSNPSQELVPKRDKHGNETGQMVRSSEAILAAQLSRLVVAGDNVQLRAESKKRAKMEKKNNSILQKHYRVSAGDSRFGSTFC